MSTITMAPPGVFATSMPPELSNSASPVLSSEDRESVSSTESRRRRLGGVTNCTLPVAGPNPQALSSSYCTSPTFVIESPKPDHSNEPFAKVRKKTRCHRNRGGGGSQNGNTSYSVNKPLKVTIRRTNAHSHTLNSTMQDGSVNRLSPSSVYSSVPGDDETSPIRVLSPHHHHHNIPNSCSSKAVDYTLQGGTQRDVAVSTVDKATSTEPDHLGPCEPGTKISLTGSVWMETPGMLCVNVNWRGRSYVGTLMDFTKNGLNLACPSKMITSLSCLKNKISWNPVAASTGGNLGSSGTLGSVKTRSSNPGAAEGRGRPLTSARGRRKRRGYGQLPTSSSTNTLVSDGMESNQEDEAPSSNNPQLDTDSPIECPIEECGKRFPDFRCLQCHLQQSHRTQKKAKMEYKVEDSVQELGVPRIVSSPSAPQLAKAVSSADGAQLSESNNNDEDIPPPTLDRGPSVSEEQVSLSCDHPPTASPAYSDISDDAPATPKITVPKSAIDSNPPSWQPPNVVPQKPSQPPPKPVQNPPQSQPVDWSINSRMPQAQSNSVVSHSHPSSVPPIRSSPYDFDPNTAAALMARLQGGQFPYPPNMHPSPYQTAPPPRPHQTATPSVPFNVPRNSLAAADFSPAQLATFMAYQQELARRHQSELQRQGRSPQQQQQQRHSPHLPPGMGSQQQFRPPPQ
ncbi:hypothetical protein ACTXT7_008279 [Hymenolepis weldensis]